MKVDPRGRLERWEERMLARVTAHPVKVRIAENPRFPWQCQSSKGKSVLRPWRKPQPMDELVNIPALGTGFNGATERSIRGGRLDFRSWREDRPQANPRPGVKPGSKRRENSLEQSSGNS